MDGQRINRRQFLQWSVLALSTPWIARGWRGRVAVDAPALPAPWGRITTGRQPVRSEASSQTPLVKYHDRDAVIPLLAAVVGEAPWPTNPIWYQTEAGYIHSGYVQPVEDAPTGEVVAEVFPPGFWGQVCIPWAEARAQPNGRVLYRLYYGTVYRAIQVIQVEDGSWWYQLQDGVTYSPGPYIPSWSLRRLPPESLLPISPERNDKRIVINIDEQRLTCFEGEAPVFTTLVSSGLSNTATPRGEFRVLQKKYTSRMMGGEGTGRYDLPGVAFPVYFTRNGVAIHGTYWHNDFGRRHSHGCVNVPTHEAQWVFQWVQPFAGYNDGCTPAKSGAGTLIQVV